MDKIFLSMDGIFILQILDKILSIMFSNESLPLVGISYKTFAYKDKIPSMDKNHFIHG